MAAGCSSSTFDVKDPGPDAESDTGGAILDSDLPVDSAADAEEDSSIVDSGAPDSVPPADSSSTDSGAMADSSVVDTGTTIDSAAIDSAMVDSAAIDSGAIDSGMVDSGVVDTGVVDTGVVVIDTGPPTCPALSAALTEVWVDATSPYFMPTGTSTCPFRTILEAVTYVNSLPADVRTIRVRAGTYNESAAVVLKAQIKLVGAGAATTTIMGGGACMGIGSCIVRVEGGATLEGVTVDASPTAKHGIVTGGTDPGGFPVLRNLRAKGAVGDGNAGILTSSGSLIGPNVESTGNKYGLVIWGSQKTSISGGGNKFDGNALVGINHEGTGLLEFRGGGSASKNGTDGIKLGDTTADPPPIHEIFGVNANSNGAAGIRLLGHASAIAHDNVVVGNKVGIIAIYGPANGFDFGTGATSPSAGNNKFGTSTTKNLFGGVCTLNTRSFASLKIIGNTWPACPTTLKGTAEVSLETSCDTLPSYYDVWYRGGTVPESTSCTPG